MGEESRYELIKEAVEETHTVAMLKGMLTRCSFLKDFDRVRRLTRKADLVPPRRRRSTAIRRCLRPL